MGRFVELSDSIAQVKANMFTSHYVAPLSAQVAGNVTLFGAKAATLSEAVHLGFTVPAGVAVSRRCADEAFISLAQKIVDELGLPLAVRSSAVKEDSAEKAFAGMFDTRLGIRSTAELVEAFKTVKQSGSSERLRKYQGETVPADDIAVLVQRMVDATRAGVAFSRDPNTGEPTVIIESNYGLGKSVVDGDVTPDSIECLSDGTYKIFIGRKSTQVVLSDNGVQAKTTSKVDASKSSLADADISGIAEMARRVETDLGFAADIEWALDAEGVLWLLQARPITTITHESEGDDA